MNDILFGNNNTKTIKRLSKQYFKKNKVRNLAAILAIVLTAFLFTSITSLAFNIVSRRSTGVRRSSRFCFPQPNRLIHERPQYQSGD